VDDYVKRKHGTMEEKYDLPELKAILKETHGVILYQEQVMNIASVLAGFSLGDADILRRAMGKKKADEMAAQREKFMIGCKKHKRPGKKADKIFSLMEKFSGYGFNKSHSAAYAQVSYQTAYLKSHYPLEFFGALITSDMDNTDKVLRYIHDCRQNGIKVQPPDVNFSAKSFSISENQLVFGLGAIKNVGSAAIDSIIEIRGQSGRFPSFKKFCESVDLRQVNKRVLESLIKSGACDSLDETRSSMMNNLQATMEMAQANQRDLQLGQSSMFGVFEEQASKDETGQQAIEEWGEQERLKNEKESIGFYITGHPLDGYTQALAWFTDANSASISESGHKKKVSLAGIPNKVLTKTTRKGDKMAIVMTLEDLQGSVEVILWPEIFSAAESLLQSEEPMLIKGEVDAEGSLPKVIANEIHPLSEAKNHWIGKVHIHLRTPGLEKETLLEIKKILAAHKGSNDTFIHFNFPDNNVRTIKVDASLRVQPSDEVVRDIEAILGEEAILFE